MEEKEREQSLQTQKKNIWGNRRSRRGNETKKGKQNNEKKHMRKHRGEKEEKADGEHSLRGKNNKQPNEKR